jgi:ABC-type multidrug transport system fused ATPase/permease subunit
MAAASGGEGAQASVRKPVFGALIDFVRDFGRFVGRRAYGAALFLMLGALLEGVGLLLLLPLLSLVLGAKSGNAWLDGLSRWLLALAPGSSRFVQLLFLLGLFAGLLAIRAFVILRRDVTLAKLQVGFVEFHRVQIIRLLARCGWDVVSRLRHGRVTHVLGADVQACGDAAFLLLQSLVAITMLAGQCLLIVLISPLLAAIILGLLLVGAISLGPVLRRSQALGEGVTEASLGLATTTNQFLGALKLALSQNLQGSFVAEFENASADAASRRIDFTRQKTASQLTLTALAAAIAGIAILIGIGLLGASAATLVAFLFILARMSGPAAQIQAGAQHVFHSLPAYAKMKELEAELGTVTRTRAAAPATPAPIGGDIGFRAVTFRHQERADSGPGEKGVEDIDLVIREGSFLGVTGASGAGKTTFADLLVGLYPPDRGTISIGGDRLDAEHLPSWRESVSYVSQDPFLFHDSIRRNLLWARPGVSDEEIWAALELGGAAALVRRMEGALDAVAGERGTLISGGERQRIALARALIRRPKLLVLDEATNAIDVEGERAILAQVRNAAPDRTIVMIAHREASLALCTRRIELREGRIVADSGD